MRERVPPRLSKWPFFAGDALLLAVAAFVCAQSSRPLGLGIVTALVLCVGAAAVLGALPFILEYRAAMKFSELDRLSSTVTQIKKVEQLAALIGGATSQWLSVRESADKTAAAAKEVAEGMAGEMKSFTEFLKQANEGEKAALRLEADKLRRAEMESLQVIVRMLDHVYALNQAALRSRQQTLIDQLGAFQNACRDAARRVGLTPFVADQAEPFDEKRHQLVDGHPKPAGNTTIEETVATGYTFQGKLLRPALVRLRNGAGAPAPATQQSQLPLDAAKVS